MNFKNLQTLHFQLLQQNIFTIKSNKKERQNKKLTQRSILMNKASPTKQGITPLSERQQVPSSLSSSSSFLEVTINSQKLSSFLQRIENLISAQDRKIHTTESNFDSAIQALNEKIQKIEWNSTLLHSELQTSITNESLILKDSIESLQSKLQSNSNTLQDKIVQIRLDMVQQKQANTITENKANFSFDECKKIKTMIHTMQEIQQKMANMKVQLVRSVNQEMQALQEQKMIQVCQDSFFKILGNDRVRNILARMEPMERLNPGDEGGEGKKGGERVFNYPYGKNPTIDEKDSLFYASVSEKISQLEKSLSERGNECLNKIFYPSSKSKPNNNDTKKQNKRRGEALDQFKNEQLTENMNKIIQKLQSIESININSAKQIKEQFLRQQDKRYLLDERLSILHRKFDKSHYTLGELKSDLKKFTERKFDEKLIDKFRFQIRQLALSFDDNLSRKISKDIFEKENVKVFEKLKIINENLTEKTDKFEVKKAIRFIEEKIKEIIFLVAGNFDDTANGALQKKKVACLSCDKDLETELKFFKETLTSNKQNSTERTDFFKRRNSSMKMKASTNRVRKNIRLGSSVRNVTTTNPKDPMGMGSAVVSPIESD